VNISSALVSLLDHIGLRAAVTLPFLTTLIGFVRSAFVRTAHFTFRLFKMPTGVATPASRLTVEADPAVDQGGLQGAVAPPFTYNSDCIRAFSTHPSHILRATRKILFLCGIWRPAVGRRRASRLPPPSSPAGLSLRDDRPLEPTTSPPPALIDDSCTPAPPNGLRLATWNVHSLGNKYVAVADTILSEGLDLLLVTESWHSSSTDVAVRRSSPPGYSYVDCPRAEVRGEDSSGGGLVIYHRTALPTRRIKIPDPPTTFEVLAASVASPRGPMTVITIYRPSSIPLSAAFFSELAALFEQFALHNTQLVVAGDLNLHLEDPELPETMDFVHIAEQFGLVQRVSEPTHRQGGWLDVLITRDDCQLTDIAVHPPTVSDHGIVIATVPFLHETPTLDERQLRNWKALDRDAFRQALLAIPVIADPASLTDVSTSDLFAIYESSMADTVNALLPARTVRTRRSVLTPWFDGECRSYRRQARRLERRYRRTKSADDRVAWIRYVRGMHRKYKDKEQSYWERKIALHSGESRKLWATLNDILGRSRSDQPASLFTADAFLEAFTTKVRSVREATAGCPPPIFPSTNCGLSTLSPVTSEELRRTILASAPKTCNLDPLPTFILQEFVDTLLPFLTVLCNRSLCEGVLPISQKRSILVPVPKAAGLDMADPVNFRPIANVSFLSKVIEKIVAAQLTHYLDKNGLLPTYQSGFRKGHSTETLLVRLLSDIYGAIDQSQVTLLALFDVSAAFDTVDHAILLQRLSISFGLSGNVLGWLTSFLQDRSFMVAHGSTRSTWVPAPFGLPQGSVLGPLLYIIFTADLGPLLAAAAVLSQSYADDIQAYVHCSAGQAVTAVGAIERATETLQNWMSTNRLRLNPTKTQLIWLGTRQQLAKIDLEALALKYPHLTFSSSVRDLGVTLDQELTFVKHINLLCRSCYYQLRQLRVISRSLSPEAASTLVHSFVVSRLDYCSAIYDGLPACRLTCLDRVLRTAARLVGRISKFGQVSVYMRDILHWLPYPQRITYRVSALVRRCIEGLAPPYLRELCRSTVAIQRRESLRSAVQAELLVPRSRTTVRQRRAFAVAGPVTWNGLPVALRLTPLGLSALFLSSLKTVLFDRGWAGSAPE
jgi:exonuclease III